ncbi:ADP-ribosylglycohydrolase family protein [Rothia uropygialis]|uniref:ADP-ribosylglycohydrolase family protein n=1 Tax=Kocuria sp. 36 TaxID=1415402 RepID=UPI00101CDF97|nr:ADP-ribosylglycohydrolase family protein [Kocuria sp. 36]
MSDIASLPPSFTPLDPAYEETVRRLTTIATTVAPALSIGTLAALEGMSDVVEWASRGQSADETASIWLQNFRWARTLGLTISDDAPVPPRTRWEDLVLDDQPRFSPRLSEIDPISAEALILGHMQYPARHAFPEASSAAFLPRLTPLAFYPQDSAPHLGQLAANVTSLTHGSPEALASGIAWVFLLRYCLSPEASDGSSDTERVLGACRRIAGFLPPSDGNDTEVPRGLRAQYAATGSSPRSLRGIFASAPLTTGVLRSYAGNTGASPAGTPACVSALASAIGNAAGSWKQGSTQVSSRLGLVLREAIRLGSTGALPAPAVPRALDSCLERWIGAMHDWSRLVPSG